jgi:hypothetical protein
MKKIIALGIFLFIQSLSYQIFASSSFNSPEFNNLNRNCQRAEEMKENYIVYVKEMNELADAGRIEEAHKRKLHLIDAIDGMALVCETYNFVPRSITYEQIRSYLRPLGLFQHAGGVERVGP